MKRIFSHPRIAAGTLAFLILVAVSAILLKPQIAQAFTIPEGIIFFDPISVPPGHTVHVNIVNHIGTGPFNFTISMKPTTPAVGTPPPNVSVSLAPGAGTDQSFTFASFSPPAGTTRVPFVCTLLVDTPTGMVPNDFSGRIASSIEIVDDATGKPTEILASRHIVFRRNPCLDCS